MLPSFFGRSTRLLDSHHDAGHAEARPELGSHPSADFRILRPHQNFYAILQSFQGERESCHDRVAPRVAGDQICGCFEYY